MEDTLRSMVDGINRVNGNITHVNGMTLRDYFAGQVLSGLSNRKGQTAFSGDRLSLAHDAYSLADAMLEARK